MNTATGKRWSASFLLYKRCDIKNDGTYEYPRYPIETLIDKGGDCEGHGHFIGSHIKRAGF
jgi:hypothetical protein